MKKDVAFEQIKRTDLRRAIKFQILHEHVDNRSINLYREEARII